MLFGLNDYRNRELESVNKPHKSFAPLALRDHSLYMNVSTIFLLVFGARIAPEIYSLACLRALVMSKPTGAGVKMFLDREIV